MDDRVVHVQILGSSFDLRSDEDPVYMNQLIAYLKRKVDETVHLTGGKDTLKTALLAGLLVTDELFKTRKTAVIPPEKRLAEAEISEITKRMIERLDKSLST